MSAYRTLYDKVFEALETIEEIKTVQDYNAQYEDDDQYAVVKYPACYVETGTVEWNKDMNSFYDKATDPQTGTADIMVHVVIKTLKGFDKATKDSYFTIIDKVVNTLQKLQSGNTYTGTFTTLMRVAEEYNVPNRQLRSAILTFETQLTDIFEERDTVTETLDATIVLDIE